MNGVTLNGSPQSGSDSASDSDEFGEEPAGEVNGNLGADASIEHRYKQASGAPQPLEAELVTLSLLPRSQWQSLVHLDAIKVALLTATSYPCCASLAVSPFEMADTACSSCCITCLCSFPSSLHGFWLEAVSLVVCACKAVSAALQTDLWPGLVFLPLPACNQQSVFIHTSSCWHERMCSYNSFLCLCCMIHAANSWSGLAIQSIKLVAEPSRKQKGLVVMATKQLDLLGSRKSPQCRNAFSLSPGHSEFIIPLWIGCF